MKLTKHKEDWQIEFEKAIDKILADSKNYKHSYNGSPMLDTEIIKPKLTRLAARVKKKYKILS